MFIAYLVTTYVIHLTLLVAYDGHLLSDIFTWYRILINQYVYLTYLDRTYKKI